jgi:hypothetical protein
MAKQSTYLIIGTPCYGGQITSAYFISLLKLQEACLHAGVRVNFLMSMGDALITRARQNILTYFIEVPEATHLLFIDADIGFEPEQVFRLLRFDEDVTAGLYPLKRVDWSKIRSLALADCEDLESASLSYVYEPVKPQHVRHGFAKARYVGTGFLMLKRAALLAMAGHYPELRYRRLNQADDPFRDNSWRFAFFNCIVDQTTGSYLSEDYSFCRRWTDMGREIWVDLESRLDHIGQTIFKGNVLAKNRGLRSLIEPNNTIRSRN